MKMLRQPYHCLGLVAGLLALTVGLALHMWPDACCQHFPLQQDREASDEVPAEEAANADCGSPNGHGVVRDLDTRGFFVVPGFLPPADVAKLLEHHEGLSGRDSAGYEGSHSAEAFGMLSPESRAAVDKLRREIQQEIGLGVIPDEGDPWSLATYTTFYSTNASVNGTLQVPWHQDHATYYMAQTIEYAKFYIMLDTHQAGEAGLSVIPFDRLLKRAPELHGVLRNTSASNFYPLEEDGGSPKTLILTNAQGDRFYIADFDVTRLACTPHLKSGDLLVFRGNLPHRSQPHKQKRSHRIAIAWNFYRNTFAIPKIRSEGIVGFRNYKAEPMMYHGHSIAKSLGLTDWETVEWTSGKLAHQALVWGWLESEVRLGLTYRNLLLRVRAFVGKWMDETPVYQNLIG